MNTAMTTVAMRKKLVDYMKVADDKKVKAIYTMVEDEIETGLQRRKLIQAERDRYLSGEGKSFNWEEVKQMATDKRKRRAI
jgi:hypothetical protein